MKSQGTVGHKTKMTILASPIGPLTLTKRGRALTGLHMEMQRHPPSDTAAWERDDGAFDDVIDQLESYFAGSLQRFDLPIELHGTPFQRRVWAGLQDIPFGSTSSYGALAQRIGKPGASRAVGLANGRNPIAIIVPCHRVIGADGTLTGYGGGLDRKRWLLDHERKELPLDGDHSL